MNTAVVVSIIIMCSCSLTEIYGVIVLLFDITYMLSSPLCSMAGHQYLSPLGQIMWIL